MRSLSYLLVALVIFVAPSLAQAERKADGSGHVVHTRMAPVLLHRAVPPFKGVHVYQGESRSAKK